MLMKFKNKMMMALEKMCQESEKLGGIPSEILVSEEEATYIILENYRLKEEKIIPYEYLNIEVTQDETGIYNFFPSRLQDAKNIRDIVAEWHKKNITVSFVRIIGLKTKKIPLRIDKRLE